MYVRVRQMQYPLPRSPLRMSTSHVLLHANIASFYLTFTYTYTNMHLGYQSVVARRENSFLATDSHSTQNSLTYTHMHLCHAHAREPAPRRRHKVDRRQPLFHLAITPRTSLRHTRHGGHGAHRASQIHVAVERHAAVQHRYTTSNLRSACRGYSPPHPHVCQTCEFPAAQVQAAGLLRELFLKNMAGARFTGSRIQFH